MGGGQIPFHNGLEHRHAHAHLVQVFLIFFRRRGNGAHHVAEVVQHKAGHDRIQVNDADGVVRILVQHDVVDFGVVMGDAGGKHAAGLEVQQTVHVLLARLDEVQFRKAGGKAFLRILRRHFHQAVEAVPGVVESGNGFHDVVRIHVADQVLEGAECKSGLVRLAGVFHHVVGMRACQVIVAAPDAVAGNVDVVAAARAG